MVNQAIQMVLLNPICLGLILLGVVIGIIFGSIPGLSASMAMILFLLLLCVTVVQWKHNKED